MKKLKKLNIMLTFLSLFIILVYFWDALDNKNYTTLLLCISLILGFLSIYYIDIKTRYKIPESYKLLYLSFLFMAAVMGALVNLYKYIGIYDNIMHFISGIIATYIAYVIFKHFSNDKSKVMLILFLISFNLGIAVCWEFIEYFIDIIFNLDTQKVALYGVDDTMQDMLYALLGSIIFILIYHKRKGLLHM